MLSRLQSKEGQLCSRSYQQHSSHLLKLSSSQYRREYRSGAVYHGELDGYKKSGRGIFKWPNGACYDGEYTNNKRQGRGKQYWPDGAVYDGEFNADLREGFGKVTFPDGESYEGEFHRDKKHGKGTYIWPDVTSFTGQFYMDRKEGFGCFTFASGNVFQGIYKLDVREGPGIMTYSDGREDVGIWLEEKLIKLCSVMESAFLFQHFSEYNVNAGQNLSGKVRRANSAWESVRNTPLLDENQNDQLCKNNIPKTFPYLDILDGLRGGRGSKGSLEVNSEELLNSATAGDCIAVNCLLQTGGVHVDVADKTGYTPLLAAAVNCHRDVINCLLDHGANVNKLNDEGLSVLAACHVLFYTRHTWKDNIAESIPPENLFNYIQEDSQKGIFIHRNCRASESTDNLLINSAFEKGDNDSETEITQTKLEDYDEDKSIIVYGSQPEKLDDIDLISDENKQTIHILDKNFETRMSLGIQRGFDKELFLKRTKSLKERTEVLNDDENSEDLIPTENIYMELEKLRIDSKSVNETSMFSIMSVVSTKNISSDIGTEDTMSESSLQQHKQCYLTMQRRPHLEATVRLLLKRGADPNASSLPMPVLFFATKAADTAANEILLQKGANTSAKLSHEKLGIAPLHIAVALPDPAGIQITELLLESGADADIRDSAFGTEVENGRTPLHIACSREDNDEDACAVVRLLLVKGANPDLPCEGHSPLSLAICSGNDLAVDALLEYDANPSLQLKKGVGSALCAATSFAAERRRTPQDTIKLINKLMRHSANILAPVTVTSRFPPGTVVDYAYNVFYQDRKIAHTPYHALSNCERDCYNARREMLQHLGDLLRTQVLKKEKELIEKQLEQLEKQEIVETPRSISQPQLGILKTRDKPKQATETVDQRSPTGMYSRVTFSLDKLEIEKAEELDLEKEADREIEAIMNKDKIPEEEENIQQVPSIQSFQSLSISPGRDDKCGLRIAVMKSTDHMVISALATETLKMRRKVMKNRFRYCYECGRSIGVRLSACTRCKEVFYCSKSCKLKAWNVRHREECVRLTGGSKLNIPHRDESPTPTTDPDDPAHPVTPSHSNTGITHRSISKGGKRTPKDADHGKKGTPAASRNSNRSSSHRTPLKHKR